MGRKIDAMDINIKNSYIWNTLAGILNSFQLFLLLLIIPRTNGQVAAGIVSGAFAIGNLVMAIGKYGMRSFQISDVSNKYSDKDYYVSRLITNALMLVAFLVYGVFLFVQNIYSVEKLIVLLLVCLLKWLDAYEDVFHGMLQRDERFDIASKAMAIRLICTIGVQILFLFLTKDLIISFAFSLVVSIILLYVLTIKPSAKYWLKKKTNGKSVVKLLNECLPLGLWMFVNMYIGNFPKYAIDAYLSDRVQAVFNYIFMPVFVINLLNTFIFQPLTTKVSQYWRDARIREFSGIACMQFMLIVGMTLCAEVLGYLFGIPLLEWFFSCELSQYRTEFLLLLLCGGLLAIDALYAMLLTIMRKQMMILVIYGLGAIGAFVMQKNIITDYGIKGITLLYMLMLFIMAVVLGVAVFYKIRKRIVRKKENDTGFVEFHKESKLY